MTQNPLPYTSRDFRAIKSDLDNLFPNKPDWFKIAIAGLFDNAHLYLDARANNILLDTAFTPEAILRAARFLDYYPRGLSPSTAYVVVKVKDDVTLPYTISVAQQRFELRATPTSAPLIFEGLNNVTITGPGRFVRVPVRSGFSVSNQSLGFTDGTDFQEFAVGIPDLQQDTLSFGLVVSESPFVVETWELRDSLINSQPGDKHFRLIRQPDGVFLIQLGDGVYGEKPIAGVRAVASYVRGGGLSQNIRVRRTQVANQVIGVTTSDVPQTFVVSDSIVIATLSLSIGAERWVRVADLTNVPAAAKVYTVTYNDNDTYTFEFGNGVNGATPPIGEAVSISYQRPDNATINYVGGDASVETVRLFEDFVGGSEAETLARTRTLAPMSLKIKDRAVLDQDFEYLSKRFSTSIVAAKTLPFYYGANTVGVHIIPAGGGIPSTPLKTLLQNYLKDNSPLRILDVRVRNPKYVPDITDPITLFQSLTISTTVTLRPGGFSQNRFYAYSLLVLRLLTSEVATELVALYQSAGLQSVVDFINVKWSFAGYIFTDADYAELVNVFTRIAKNGVSSWGARLRPNDIVTELSELSGVDYVEVHTPTTTIALPYDRIFSDANIVYDITVQG